jgi:predicted nucleic acid-binding protein
LIERYSVLAEIIEPAILSSPVSPAPDDDVVLATALAAHAELIVSRDKHLRNLKHFHRIPILNATGALQRIIAQG